MSVKDFTYSEFQELTYEEFYDVLWEDVSEKIVSTAYLDENEDFISNLTFDLYRLYQMHPALTIRVLSRIAEAFLFNIFRLQPMTRNIKEIVDKYS
jgi:hypothetical protein